MAFTRGGAPTHSSLADVTAAQHHTATDAGDLDLADLNEKLHASLATVTSDQHHAQTHTLTSHSDSIKAAKIVQGQYTGDAETSQAIVSLGLAPIYIAIIKVSTGGGNENMFHTWKDIVEDNANGLGYIWGAPTVHGALVIDHIRSLDSAGFTVGDDATQGSLNGSGNTYNFFIVGT